MRFEGVKKIMEDIASVGLHPDGGTNRVFGTPEYTQGCRKMETYLKDCGMETHVDAVGNVHGIWRCQKEHAQEIILGSHLDTVKEGGVFDGLLGVAAAGEVVRSINASGEEMECNLHVIGTNGEEGNDCGGTFGSRALMGLLPLENASFLETAEKFGYTKADMESARMNTSGSRCYLELHIEQGPTLFNHREQIGIVSGIVGLRRYRVTVYGRSNHAGTTMMEDRNDALVSAAALIQMGDVLARETGHHFVETVGLLQVFPGSVAVIPGKVEMVLEMRNEDTARMDSFLQEYEKRAKKIVDIRIEPIVSKQPVQCDPEIINTIRDCCGEQNLRWRIMPSGATHDGNAFALKMPIGMIFVPSANGVSHSKDEWTDWEDVDRGTAVLLETVRKIGNALQ